MDTTSCAPLMVSLANLTHQMNLVLMERHGLDPSGVITVGDRPIDIDAARAAGIEGFLLISGPYPNTTTISSLARGAGSSVNVNGSRPVSV